MPCQPVDRAFSELFQCFHFLLGNREVLKYLQEFHRPGSGKYVCSVRAWSCVSNGGGKVYVELLTGMYHMFQPHALIPQSRFAI